jgi:GntR family transcriptional regulator
MSSSDRAAEVRPSVPEGSVGEASILRTLSPSTSLPERAAENVRAAIRNGHIVRDGRLPTEPDLAKQLGISRATLRHAISILEEEGLVLRRQGKGTFVVEQMQQLENNMNQNFGVTDLIEAAGGVPGTLSLKARTEWADRNTARRLALPPRSQVHVIQRTRTANGKPVAYTVDVIPVRVFAECEFAIADVKRLLGKEQSLYRLLAVLGIVVHHGIATIEPVALDADIARALKVATGTLALLLDQVDYTADGEPVVLSHEYHPQNVLSVQVYRKGPGPRW